MIELNKKDNLRDVFSLFGTIEELVLMKDQDGTSKGCAFIKFKQKEDALLAIRFLNGNVYISGSDKPVEVRLAEKIRTKTPQTTTVESVLRPYQQPTPSMNPMMVCLIIFRIKLKESSLLQVYCSRWHSILFKSYHKANPMGRATPRKLSLS